MQVTHVESKVTHAVIGGGAAREFGISNSAEFFNILSNALYSDKILAVVREVLCNAWDIHIETGITDKPVKVTLGADNKLTIQDFGTGISDEDIVIVYGTYGNSTKKLDGKQTGGFGLGSKAPFAYVEHFEVASCYQGTKTVYTMSKSSGEVAGKPSTQTVVSVPTTETGLSVSFKVQPIDINRFRDVIYTIARFGEMNVEYNGVALETIPFSQAKQGFLITKGMQGISGADAYSIFIRYGNVVYPVSIHADFAHEYGEINKFLKRIGNEHHWGNRSSWNVIFQAKPNTISVTPSRESLSMTDHTVKNLKELFVNFLNIKEAELSKNCLKLVDDCISDQWVTGRPSNLLNSDNQIVGIARRASEVPNEITNFQQVTAQYSRVEYPEFTGFRNKDINKRLTALIENRFGNVGKIQSFRAEFASKGNVRTDWFQRVIVGPLITKMSNIKGLNPTKLQAYAAHKAPRKGGDSGYRYGNPEETLVEASKLSPRPLEHYLPFLRNVLILAFNRMDVFERAPNFPAMRHWFGDVKNNLVYITPRNTEKIDIARKFFQDQGYFIIDLTVAQKWEHKEAAQPAIPIVTQKPRKKGLAMLSGAIDPETSWIRPNRFREIDDLERIEKPEFIIKISGQWGSSDLKYYDEEAQKAVVLLYGKIGGVVVNSNQEARFRSMGVPKVQTWLIQRMIDELQTNPKLRNGLSLHHWRISQEDSLDRLSYDKREFLGTIEKIPALTEYYGITNPMGLEERMIFAIIKDYCDSAYHRNTPEINKIKDLVKAIPINSKYQELMDKVSNSKILSMFYKAALISSLDKTSKIPQSQKDAVKDIVIYALES